MRGLRIENWFKILNAISHTIIILKPWYELSKNAPVLTAVRR
jgi:hypothetical protein